MKAITLTAGVWDAGNGGAARGLQPWKGRGWGVCRRAAEGHCHRGRKMREISIQASRKVLTRLNRRNCGSGERSGMRPMSLATGLPALGWPGG